MNNIIAFAFIMLVVILLLLSIAWHTYTCAKKTTIHQKDDLTDVEAGTQLDEQQEMDIGNISYEKECKSMLSTWTIFNIAGGSDTLVHGGTKDFNSFTFIPSESLPRRIGWFTVTAATLTKPIRKTLSSSIASLNVETRIG